MTEIKFTDSAPITGMRPTSDGYMVGEVRCARTGCQTYRSSELGLVDGGTVTVYRPETAVFHKDSLATFAGKPVTLGHPSEQVTSANWRDHAVGDIGDEIARDGEFVKVPFRLMDASAIASVQDGTREVSMGYTTPIQMQDGTAPDGTPYQAIQTGPIRINHLAIVPKARGGEQLRIGDGAANWGAIPLTPTADTKGSPMADTLQTVVLGDQAAQVAVADAPKIEAFKVGMAKRITDMETAHAAAVAVLDEKLAKAEATLDAEKAKVLSDADLDKRVQDRADLIGVAKSIVSDVKTEGLADAAIRKAVVVAKLGDTMADKSAAYIDARFDIMAEDAAKADPFADGMKGGTVPATGTNIADTAYAANIAHMQSAYRNAEPVKGA
jgi:hypothetical protein